MLVARGKPTPEGDVTIVEVDDTLAALTRLGAASRDRVDGPVVSITGSNGKTTTRAMVEAVLGSALDDVLCTRGNFNNHLGVPLTLLGEPHDPKAMVVELGMSAPGENDHLARIVRPTAAVITSVALEHLEFMGSIEAIAAAEAEPIPHVREGGVVVAPADEPLLRPHLPKTGVSTFGPGDDATVVIESVQQRERTEATLRLPGGERIEIRLQTFGLHNARNAAAAICVGLHLSLPVAPMVEALEAVQPVGDRGRALSLGPHLLIADCYNANPGSVEAALGSLAALRDERPGKLVAVLGDMLELGPTEIELHADCGRRCAELGLDLVVAIGPRSKATAEAASRAASQQSTSRTSMRPCRPSAKLSAINRAQCWSKPAAAPGSNAWSKRSSADPALEEWTIALARACDARTVHCNGLEVGMGVGRPVVGVWALGDVGTQ